MILAAQGAPLATPALEISFRWGATAVPGGGGADIGVRR
jgi:hypothetical protein